MPHYTAAGWQQVPQEELDERAALKAQASSRSRGGRGDGPGRARRRAGAFGAGGIHREAGAVAHQDGRQEE
jgi:hypothetical protein